MQLVTRRIDAGAGRFTYAGSMYHTGAAGLRPRTSAIVVSAMASTNMSGPRNQGMDPSDPLTYVRPWNPQPGMIAYLNFDGAQLQATTPTQLQRGPHPHRRGVKRLRIGA